jgi:hypothetical protein
VLSNAYANLSQLVKTLHAIVELVLLQTTNNLTKSYDSNLCASSKSKYLDIRDISAVVTTEHTIPLTLSNIY